MSVAELLHHTFSWEISPGVAREDAELAGVADLVGLLPAPDAATGR